MKPARALSVDEIRLGDLEFWVRPHEEREGAFATLREERPVSFHAEPEFPLLPTGLPTLSASFKGGTAAGSWARIALESSPASNQRPPQRTQSSAREP